MKKFYLSIFLLTCVFIFNSCNSDLELNKITNQNLPFKLTLIDLKLEKLSIPVGSEKHMRLIEWLNKNNVGWKSSVASYHAKLCVSQKNFNLLYNPGSEGVVTNFIDHKKISRQYSKKIKKGELDFLNEFE